MTGRGGAAVGEVARGIGEVRLWARLGSRDLARRYRRTILGPIWGSARIVIFVAALSLVGSRLFADTADGYVFYVAAGMVLWTFLVALITESTTAFTEASQLIKQLRIPYSLLIAAMAWRNLLILGHHLVVLAIAALLFGASPGAGAPLALLGVALTTAAGLAAGLILAIICARYRDLQPLAGSVLQIAFFVTPVFWRPEQLGADARLIVGLNPLHHFLDVMRAPILGSGPALESWLAAVAMTLALWVVAIWLFARTRERIAYWV